jgi:hypothetical protein
MIKNLIRKAWKNFWNSHHQSMDLYYPQSIQKPNIIEETLQNSIAMTCINYLIQNLHGLQWRHNFNNFFTNNFKILLEEILMEWIFHGNCFLLLKDNKFQVLKTVNVQYQGKKFFYKGQLLQDYIHLKNHNIYDNPRGISPLDAIATHIIQYNTINKYLSGIAGRGGITSGIIIAKNPLNNDQRLDLQNNIREFYRNVNSQGTIMVLEGDFDWKSIAIDPSDLDIKKMNNYNGSAIARGLGIHPVLIGLDKRSYGGLQYNAIHQQFVENTLKPFYRKIIDQLTNAIGIQSQIDISIEWEQ